MLAAVGNVRIPTGVDSQCAVPYVVVPIWAVDALKRPVGRRAQTRLPCRICCGGGDGLDVVIHDDRRALGEIAGHFAATGRRRIAAILPGDDFSRSKAERLLRPVREWGLTAPRDGGIFFDSSDSYRYADRFRQTLEARFAGGVDFDAIWCGTDEGAAKTIQWLREKRLRVPEDVAVVGFNDSEFAECFDPPLASVGREEGRISDHVDEFLYSRLQKPELAPRRAIINMRFVWRRSAGGERATGNHTQKRSAWTEK